MLAVDRPHADVACGLENLLLVAGPLGLREEQMKLKHIAITICEACLEGEGVQCHTPGCALFLHLVDLPIDARLYTVLAEYEEGEA